MFEYFLIAIDCGYLLNPESGVVSLSGTVLGSTARYSCNKGFVLVGESSRKCLDSGRWSGQPPTCKGCCVTSTVFAC